MAQPIVLFETLWAEISDGWSIAARAYARAMKLGGIDVRLRSWAAIMEYPAEEVIAEVEDLLKPTPKWDFYIFSTPLAQPKIMEHPFAVLRGMERPRTFYTMFERSNVQPELIQALNDLEGVWVPCSRNEDLLRDAGCKNATWIPFPYFDSDPHLKLEQPNRQPKVFYWIGRWEPRKAPDNLIRAFLRGFKPGQAELVLKIGPVPFHRKFPGPEEVIAAEVDENKAWSLQQAQEAIQIIRGKLSPKEMLTLHARGDVYVSASRGEGLDLPSFAAKLAGRRVITTDSGGPIDFLGEGDFLVTANQEIPAVGYEEFWGAESRYSDYVLEDLIDAMREVRAGRRISTDRVPSEFRAENVGRRLREWVEECSWRG